MGTLREDKGREGTEREGMQEGRGKGKWEGRDRIWDIGKGKGGRGGKGRRGATAPKL